jgi:hypothetical protein
VRNFADRVDVTGEDRVRYLDDQTVAVAGRSACAQ